jgi:tetratricopeptide (TPR) repeat protein
MKKNTRILIAVVAGISALVFLVAYLYYSHQNSLEDPRVAEARGELARFDQLMGEQRYAEALEVIDAVEETYLKTPGYAASFEPGMIMNNRGSVFLSMALYDSLATPEEKSNLLRLAEEEFLAGIDIYTRWIDSAGQLSTEQVRANITPYFNPADEVFKGRNVPHIMNKRIDDIILAQLETPRRLSVTYTNLGIVQRHCLRQEEALHSYMEAIGLWKDNFTARSNFNVLMGKPPEDRSIIDKLFPPDRYTK